MHKLLLAGLAATMLAGPVLADDRGHDRNDRHDDRRGWQGERDGDRDDHRDWRRDRRDWRDDRHEDGWRQNAWRGNDGRWIDRRGNDWRGNDWRWSGARYRGPGYIYPRGYGYQAWGVGYRLPPAYFGGGYWIGNPGYYRLPPAYYGTRWVRVGSDALLIRLGDGLILQAVRGLYW